jgi:(E)-4-hydroxy-3-methylbut-2-enyl-diphosphate synthase
MVPTLVEWAEYINTEGIDAALDRAKATKDAARKAAEEDRDRNLNERGDDANASEQVVELMKKKRD